MRVVFLSVSFVAQVVFHFLQQRLKLSATNAQGHTGGQYVDDHQVQQA